jgi:cytoskeletal protein CcmA (bactofilin family)
MVEERRIAAWIGASVEIKGDLTSSEDLTIAGKVEGDVTVRAHAVTVASQARIRGNITARGVTVHGEVIGTITSEGNVVVGESGNVEGDIRAPRMVVMEGATLRSHVQMPARRA